MPSIRTLAKPRDSFVFSAGAFGNFFNMAFSIEWRFVLSVVSCLGKLIFPQYFARPRERQIRRPSQIPVRPVTLLARGIDAKLADGAVLFERLGTIGPHSGDNDEIALPLPAPRLPPFPLTRIPRPPP